MDDITITTYKYLPDTVFVSTCGVCINCDQVKEFKTQIVCYNDNRIVARIRKVNKEIRREEK